MAITIGHPARVPKPTLKATEREIETYRANRTQGSRAVGGHLLLTNQRVVFYPHKLDSATGGKNWECSLTSVTDVGVAARGSNPFNGSMLRRLQIDCAGKPEYFVVSKADAVLAAIRQAVGS